MRNSLKVSKAPRRSWLLMVNHKKPTWSDTCEQQLRHTEATSEDPSYWEPWTSSITPPPGTESIMHIFSEPTFEGSRLWDKEFLNAAYRCHCTFLLSFVHMCHGTIKVQSNRIKPDEHTQYVTVLITRAAVRRKLKVLQLFGKWLKTGMTTLVKFQLKHKHVFMNLLCQYSQGIISTCNCPCKMTSIENTSLIGTIVVSHHCINPLRKIWTFLLTHGSYFWKNRLRTGTHWGEPRCQVCCLCLIIQVDL